MHRTPLLIFALAFAPPVPAQEVMNRGPLASGQFLCIVGPGTSSETGALLSTSKIYLKKGGILTVAEPTPGAPDLRFERMFRDRKTSLVPAIQVDALSGGLDALNIQLVPGPVPRAAVTIPPTRWGGLLFSVERGGKDAVGSIGEEQLRSDGAGADIFDYLYKDSGRVLPRAYFNCPTSACATRREADSGEVGLNHEDGRYAEGDIVALDAHLPAYLLDAGIRALLPRQPRVFFSVTNATLGAVPAAWWGTESPSGATILMTRWTGTDWSEPRPAVTYSMLGAAIDDDIDGLSVRFDYGRATGMSVMFSTTQQRGKITSDLMYITFTGPASMTDPAPVYDGKSEVAAATGKKKTNIDGTCDTDPSFDTQSCAVPLVWNHVFGTPVELAPSPTRSLYSSLFRTCPGGTPALESIMGGWTASGRQAGTALNVWMVGDSVTPLAHILTTTQLRTASQPYGGGLVRDALPIPATMLPITGARCLHVWSVWLAVATTGTGTELAESFAVRIRL